MASRLYALPVTQAWRQSSVHALATLAGPAPRGFHETIYGVLLGCSALGVGIGTAAADSNASSGPVLAAAAAVATAVVPPDAAGGQLGTQSNHPLEFEAVVNENTARMTLAKTAALEAYTNGRYKDAEKRFREAIREAELGFGAEDPQVAACMNNLAEFYRNTGQFEQAEVLYNKALAQLEATYGEKHWLYVAALHNLALLHDSKGSFPEAEATFRRVMAIRLSMFGPRHYLYADTMFALAHTLQKWGGRSGEVVALMRKSVDVLEESGNVEATAIMYWLMELCKELQAAGQHQAAVEYLDKAMGYLIADQNEVRAQASEFADMLVVSLEKVGRLREATEQQQKCVQSRLGMFGHHPLVVRSITKLAQMEAASGQEEGRAAAVRWADMALQICDEMWQRTRGSSLQSWFSSATRIAECQERLQAGLEFGRTVLLVQRLQSLPEPAPAAQVPSTTAAASSSSSSSSSSRWWWFGRRSSSPSGSSDVPTPASSSSSSSSSSGQAPGTEAAPAAPGPAARGVQPPTKVEPAALQQLLELAVARLDESVAAARQVVGLVTADGKGAEVLGPYVDAQLGLLECLEALVAHLRRHRGPAAEPEATLMEARCEQVAAGLVALAK